MTFNLPSKVRFALYIFTSVGSLVVTYFAATGVIGSNEVALWTAFSAFVAALAGLNVNPDVKEKTL